jgi:DNA-binding NtrC family response regulator
MPDLDGMAVLERLARQASTVPVIVQTAPRAADLGAAAIRAGASDFLVKPATPERVKVSLINALKVHSLEGEILRMRLARAGTLGLGDLILSSPATERASQLAERAARASVPVLIEGERGVGKELLARAIHGTSARRSRAFVAVRCDDLGATEIESYLFGDTGEDGRPAGKLAEAAGGTLFLDAIGALPESVQDRLVRHLGEDERNRPRLSRSEPRLIASTSRRLIELVRDGGFREALFNRLNVLPIWLPPLRDRASDIPALARALLARLAAEAGRRDVSGLAPDAIALLMAHDWPGNIRELEHTIARAVVLSGGGEINAATLSALGTVRKDADGDGLGRFMESSIGVADQEHVIADTGVGEPARADSPAVARYGTARLLDETGEMRPFGVLEEEVIRFAIGHYGGRLSEVARRLGMGRSTLYRKLKGYGIGSREAIAP